ncbi:hypothetical protein F2Q69_00050776 [Brassica cretica]|uniref:histone acetyltransferase n=1 Tax=Brassica cretica TaxID=69181 RepID=A0A8S9Q3N3_BRACR|nr:hypothetical protein F2Q69_00050776 [Brassica cretica]
MQSSQSEKKKMSSDLYASGVFECLCPLYYYHQKHPVNYLLNSKYLRLRHLFPVVPCIHGIPPRTVVTMEILQALLHAHACRPTAAGSCSYPKCSVAKILFNHTEVCEKQRACRTCTHFAMVIRIHAYHCQDPNCSIPRCSCAKEQFAMRGQFNRVESVSDDVGSEVKSISVESLFFATTGDGLGKVILQSAILDKYLYNNPETALDWKQRSKIVKGVVGSGGGIHEFSDSQFGKFKCIFLAAR